MFSQTTEYALRVVVYLATVERGPITTRQIAAATKIPAGYLAKVLQSLSRAKIIRSQRGLRGGSTLIVPPDQLNLLDVVQAISPLQRIRFCPLGLAAHDQRLCTLHRRLDDAVESIEKALRESTITRLLSDVNGPPPLRDSNGHGQALSCVRSGADRLGAPQPARAAAPGNADACADSGD